MYLGLESLGYGYSRQVSSEELMCLMSDTLVKLEDMAETAQTVNVINERINMMYELGRAVRKHGYTASMQTLFGMNFDSGFSMEGLGAKIAGAWHKFVEFIKKLWQRIKDLFALIFNSFDKMMNKLKERAKEIESKGLKDETKKIKVPGLTMLLNIAKIVNKNLAADVTNVAEGIKQLGAMARTAQPDANFDEELKSRHLERFKDIILKYTPLVGAVWESGGGAIQDNYNNADDDDNITVTKSNALTLINTVIVLMQVIKDIKPKVENLQKTIEDLINDKTLRARVRMDAGRDNEQTANAVANAVIASPTGRKVINSVSQWLTKIISKISKGCIVIGSRMLSEFKPAK